MNENQKTALKLGLLANAIFFVLIFFIQRIAGFIWNLVLSVGGHLHQGYVDKIYRDAAFGDPTFVGHLTLLTLLLTTVYVVTYFMTKSQGETEALFLHGADAIRYMHRINQGVFILMSAATTLCCLAILVVVSISFGTAEIAASFNQRLTVLAPAISDVEYKTLKARWASMKGKDDYDALVSLMDNRAGELGIKLPAVRKP